MVTTQNVVDYIKDGTYPYTFRFVTGEQRYKVYPYVEVVQVSPRSKSETPETITESQTFEIRVYIRYIRTLDQEIANLEIDTTHHTKNCNFGPGDVKNDLRYLHDLFLVKCLY